MARHDQLIAQIRFALGQLSARNAQHEFEHLCRHLARATVCSNILPATGPVSAGGDQGRDFETFRSFIRDKWRERGSVGALEGKRLAFCCTLEKGVVPKIRSDVRKIVSIGVRPEVVYYFTSQDVPVAKRHKLQEELGKEAGISLEVLDGQAIAELLAAPERFWIAEHYLSIPREIFPDLGRSPDWYGETQDKYKKHQELLLSPAEFVEVRSAVRHATQNAKQDILFWIKLLEQFKSTSPAPSLRRKALYEIIVSRLRGLGTLVGFEDLVREYLSSINSIETAVELDAAVVITNYARGSVPAGDSHLSEEETKLWARQVKERALQLLSQEPSPTVECMLHTSMSVVSVAVANSMEEAAREIVKHWLEVVKLAPRAALFQLESFSELVITQAEFVGDEPLYEEVTNRLDELLSERFGAAKAAEKCRERATVFFKRGLPLRSLRELHKAKVNWYSAETLDEATRTMLLVSQLYLELGLRQAAKYYALAAASIAHGTPDERTQRLVVDALFLAADADYASGAWLSFVTIVEAAIPLHMGYRNDPMNWEAHTDLAAIVAQAANVQAISSIVAPQAREEIQQKLKGAGISDVLSEVTRKNLWKEKSALDVCTQAMEEIGDFPFSDAGPKRRIEWRALGATWNVSCENDYTHLRAAETVAAVLQIVIAELATTDLFIIPTSVNISVEASATDTEAREEPSSGGPQWKVKVKSGEESSDKPHFSETVIAVQILRSVSLRTEEELKKLFGEHVETGLPSNVFVGRTYQTLYDSVFKREESLPWKNYNFDYGGAKRMNREHAELRFRDEELPLKRATKEERLKAVKRRYEETQRIFPKTLERLRGTRAFQELVQAVRNEGWRDWHILSAVANLAMNYRNHQAGLTPEQIRKAGLSLGKPETEESSPLPTAQFTDIETMRWMRDLNMLSFAKALGLGLPSHTPDVRAIEEFLARRAGYRDDDIEHIDPFAPSEA